MTEPKAFPRWRLQRSSGPPSHIERFKDAERDRDRAHAELKAAIELHRIAAKADEPDDLSPIVFTREDLVGDPFA